MRWIDLSLGYLQNFFRHFKGIFDFSRLIWSQKVCQRLTKAQKFRESQLALKNKILSFARFLRLSFTSTFRNVIIWCALDSPGLGQSFNYLKRYRTMRRKIFRVSWSQKVRPELTIKSCFLTVNWDSRNFLIFVSFKRTFWLQVGALKIFLLIVR